MNGQVPGSASPSPTEAERRASVRVLLAAHNGMAYLPTQITTILQQEAVDVSITVSIDRSSDGTEEWFAALAADESRVRLLPTGSSFGSAAANFFRLVRDADLAGADYVAFADQDDVWFPRKLQRATSVLSGGEYVGYSSDVLAWREGDDAKRLAKAGPQRRWDHLFSSPGPGCTHVIRSDVFEEFQAVCADLREKVAGIDYHDWLDYAFVRERGQGWYIDDEPHMLYRQHAANQLGANSGGAALRRRVRMLRDGWLLHQSALICEVVGAQDSAPYRQLMRRGLPARLRLMSMAPHFRRTRRDAVALAVSFLFAKQRGTQ